MFNSINGLDIYALVNRLVFASFLKKKKWAVFNTDLGDRDPIPQDFLALVFTATSDVHLLDFHILPIEKLNPKYGISQQISLKPNFIMTR